MHEVEKRLAAAQERFGRAGKALAAKHRGEEWEEYWSAYYTVLELERELAAARGEEYAFPLEFPTKWDAGALPHRLRNDLKTFVTFYIRERDPNGDGSCVRIRNPADPEASRLALVEFFGCVSAKLGTPNDEVFEGHPLSGRGLDGCSAQKVVNSRWLAELEAINKVHRCYNSVRWRGLNHYIFWFHDTTFECVAESFKLEVYQESMADLLGRVCQRLLS